MKGVITQDTGGTGLSLHSDAFIWWQAWAKCRDDISLLVWGKIKEATGHDIVWPREKEDPILWQFIYLSFWYFWGVVVVVEEQVGEFVLSARSCGESRDNESQPLPSKVSYPVLWGDQTRSLIDWPEYRKLMKRAVIEIQLTCYGNVWYILTGISKSFL